MARKKKGPKATIQFFHLLDGKGSRFKQRQDLGQQVLDPLEALPYSARARENVGGMRMTSDVWDPGDGAGRVLTVYRTRGSQLPGQEVDGAVSDLDLDPRARGLAEGTSVMFFDPNVMAVMFNREGPSFAKVTSYISEVTPFDCTAVMLVDPETWRRLRSMEGVSELVMRARAGNLAGLQQTDPSTASAMRQTVEAFEMGDVEVVVRFRGEDRFDDGNRAKEIAARLLRTGGAAYMNKLTVKGVEDGHVSEPVNLLAARVSIKREVDYTSDGSRRRVRPDLARHVIGEAYAEARDAIERALR